MTKRSAIFLVLLAIIPQGGFANNQPLTRDSCRDSLETYLTLKLAKYSDTQSKQSGKKEAYQEALEYVGYLTKQMSVLGKYTDSYKERRLKIEHALSSVVKKYAKGNSDGKNALVCADFLLKRRLERRVSNVPTENDILIGLERIQSDLKLLRANSQVCPL